MNISKKLLLITLCVCMIVSSFPALAQEDANTFLRENFNGITTGGLPSGDFISQRAGNADMGVVEIPDAKNKSIYMRASAGGAASLEGSVVNPEFLPITISFRFMVPEGCNIEFPTIKDDKGVKKSLLTLSGTVLKSGDTVVADLQTRRWYYAAVSLNLSENTYRVAIDGNNAEARFTFPCSNVTGVSFEVSGSGSAIYFDDIYVAKTTVGGPGHESWPSKMWTTDAQQQVVDDISLSNFTMFNMSRVAYKNGVKMEMPAPVREIDAKFYVPLRFTAENIGAEVVWNEKENAVYMMFGGKTTKVLSGGKVAYVDGTEQALSSEIKVVDGTTYIYYEDIAALLGREVNQANGYIMFGPDWDYYQKSETAVREELYRMVKYQRPTGDDIYKALIAKNPNKSHPRVFAHSEDFAKLKNLWTTDAFAGNALNYLKARAEEFIKAHVTPYKSPATSGSRMYSERRPHEIINTCGLMYHLTGDTRYAERAKKELMNMITFPELGTISILDLGDTGECIGIAYDWLYNYEGFTEEDKKLVRDVAAEKILLPLLSCYRGGVAPYESIRMSWVYSRYNFNSHINTGALMLLLAMADDYEGTTHMDEYVKPIFGYLTRSVEFFFDEWYPDGAWHEGPGYGTAVIYQLAHFVAALESATGTTFGFTDVPGIIESGIWSLHVEGPTGMFNYSDAGDGENIWGQYSFWMSETLDEDIFAAKRREDLEKGSFQTLEAIEMLWYNPERGASYTPLDVLDAYFRGVETTTMRSGWGDNDIFAGFHSGLNGINHAHIDTGSFVFDWGGTRWVKDIGVDSATSHWYAGGVNDWGVGYRERAEGHNTLVFDDTPYKTYADGEWPIVFEDDFEGYEIDSDPSKFTISEANSNTNAQGEVGIVNVERAKTDENSQNKAMRLEMSREKKTTFYAQKAFGTISTNFAKSALELTFKFKLEDFDESGDMNFINFYSPDHTSPEGVTTPHGTVFGLNIQKGNVLRSQNGSSYVTLMTLDPATWYDMKFRVDVKTQTMNIWIDGEHLGKDLKLPKTIVGISYVRFSSAGNFDFKALLDDVVIRVSPEDAALALSAAKLYDQTLYCNSPIIDYVSKERGAYAVTDMSAAYIAWVNSAKRGVMLTNNRNTFIVRDEIDLKNKSDVYWFAHSDKGDVQYTISEDGKSAILENPTDKSRVWAGIISDTPNAKFTVMEADPLPGSPRPANQADNSMFHKLTIKFTGAEGKLDFSVAFIPLDAGKEKPAEIPEDASFDEWSIPDGELPKLDSVTLNGEIIENFEPSKTSYSVNIRSDKEVPFVAASYQGKEIEVEQAASLYDYASFTVQNGGETINYRVNFIVEEVTYGYIQGHPITDDCILYSSITTPDCPPKRLIDGDITTECASLGDGEWFIFDFKEPREFSALEIMWCYGEGRNYDFEIFYSDDAATWKNAFSGQSSAKGDVFDRYEFDKPVTGRYLKFVGHGNNKNLYNNIFEIR